MPTVTTAAVNKCKCCKEGFSCNIQHQGQGIYLMFVSACSLNVQTINWSIRKKDSRKVLKNGSVNFPLSGNLISIDLSDLINGSYVVAMSSPNCVGGAMCEAAIDQSTISPGFLITGIGQNVTGASPQQDYHTVASPARVVNIQTIPIGQYSGSVTINSHTEPIVNLNTAPTGYPAIFFNPTNPVWGIVTPGTYGVSITLNINGVDYTQTTDTVVTNADLGIVVSQGTGIRVAEPIDPNPNVEITVDNDNIRSRFKFVGGSGNYGVNVRHNGATISTQNNLSYNNGYVEVVIPTASYRGETLVYEFTGTAAGNVSYFVPKLILHEFEPDSNDWRDNVIHLRITKPFNNNRYVFTDIGDNLDMNVYYWLNGTVARMGQVWRNDILTNSPQPALRHHQIIKSLLDKSVSNINIDGYTAWNDNTPTKNMRLSVLHFWIKTAVGQEIGF